MFLNLVSQIKHSLFSSIAKKVKSRDLLVLLTGTLLGVSCTYLSLKGNFELGFSKDGKITIASKPLLEIFKEIETKDKDKAASLYANLMLSNGMYKVEPIAKWIDKKFGFGQHKISGIEENIGELQAENFSKVMKGYRHFHVGDIALVDAILEMDHRHKVVEELLVSMKKHKGSFKSAKVMVSAVDVGIDVGEAAMCSAGLGAFYNKDIFLSTSEFFSKGSKLVSVNVKHNVDCNNAMNIVEDKCDQKHNPLTTEPISMDYYVQLNRADMEKILSKDILDKCHLAYLQLSNENYLEDSPNKERLLIRIDSNLKNTIQKAASDNKKDISTYITDKLQSQLRSSK